MEKSIESHRTQMAKEIARAAIAIQKERIGRAPESVTAVISDDTLVITLRGVLSPAEKALANNPEDAARLQEFHRRLFGGSSDVLRREIERITGVRVQDATVDLDSTGVVVNTFISGTVVQVYLLAGIVPADIWSEHHRGIDD